MVRLFPGADQIEAYKAYREGLNAHAEVRRESSQGLIVECVCFSGLDALPHFVLWHQQFSREGVSLSLLQKRAVRGGAVPKVDGSVIDKNLALTTTVEQIVTALVRDGKALSIDVVMFVHPDNAATIANDKEARDFLLKVLFGDCKPLVAGHCIHINRECIPSGSKDMLRRRFGIWRHTLLFLQFSIKHVLKSLRSLGSNFLQRSINWHCDSGGFTWMRYCR